MRIRATWVGALMMSLLSSACGVDQSANMGRRCGADGSCPGGTVCYREFCVIDESVCEGDQEAIHCSDRGAEGLTPVGACRPGTQRCVDGTPTECEGEVRPAAVDGCDGNDEDCDGATDEDIPATCDTGELGVCRDGAPACRNGTMLCAALGEPAEETCDNLDNDCDGLTDEALSAACYPASDGGCTDEDDDGVFECTGTCRAGAIRCIEGSETACEDAVAVVAEVCGVSPAADDDCDGEVDEGCPCSAEETQSCYGGSMGTAGVGPCTAGTQTCTGGEFGPCEGQRVDTAETCDNAGADDDCNGVDDDIPMLEMSCGTGLLGRCALGIRGCVGPTLECIAPEPRTESCDGRDDDCDGSTDEDFDTDVDAANCGACGVTCGTGSVCCGGACVDTSTNPMSCGACGAACGAGQTCCGGSCVDTMADEAHCGGCGASCPGECCGGSCTDVRSDTDNCGACGDACGASESCCGSTCAAPTAPACTGCPTDCAAEGQTCCGGSCVDLTSDEGNCGACGTSCGVGNVCCGGACVVSDESACGQSCSLCGGSQLCCSGGCVDEGSLHCNACGSACPSPNSCCGDGCFNLMTDDAHCGSCDVDCTPLGQQCSSGHCCPPGQTFCGGACVNTGTNANHCGGCGNACPLLRPNCRMGSCSTF